MFGCYANVIADIAGHYDFEFVQMPATEVRVVGWLEPGRRYRRTPSAERLWRRRGPDFDATVFDDVALWGDTGAGRVAYITAIFLPESLQRRGFGRKVIHELSLRWCDDGVVEVQASAKTAAGGAALSSWGFRPGVEDLLDLPGWYRSLRNDSRP
jgi:hypothetical protein